MASPRLNQAKLRVPGLTSAPVVRRSLLARLEAHRGRLVLVSAPAGFGKTALVADWITRRAVPAAWLSLDALDDEPSRLAAHLAAALRGMEWGDVEPVADAIEKAPAGDGGRGGDLGDRLGAVGSEGILVLDDLHQVESLRALGLIEQLIHAPGSPLRLVLVTRADPPLPLARLRLSGELVEVRARDLAFSHQEASTLLDDMGIPALAPSELATLVARTEGWPAGLRLAGIALADADDPTAVVSSFAGTHRFVTEYLLEEAVGRQSPELQTFLMESAVLSRFDVQACREILDDPEAHLRLEEVRAASLFLVPLGADGTWYRYHHLFGELLTYRLRRTLPGRLEELRLRASRWFESRGDLHEAMEQASQVGDKDRLLELLDRYGLALISRSELAGIRRWLGEIDPTVVRPFPLAWCTEAWLRIVTERVSDPTPLIRRIEEALELTDEDYDPEDRIRALFHMRVLAAYAARYRHQWQEALELGRQAEAIPAEPDPLTRGFLVYNTARVRMALGEMRDARALLEQGYPDQLLGGNRYLVLATLGRIGAVCAQTEGVRAALASLDAATTFAREQGLDANPALSIVHLHRGWTHLLADELDEAEGAFDLAGQAAGAQDFPEERGNALVGSARVAMARGDTDRAEALLQEVSALEQAGNVDLFDTTLRLERLRLALHRDASGAGPPAPARARYLAPVEDHGDSWTVLHETATVLAAKRALLGSAPDEGLDPGSVRRLVDESRRLERGPALVSGLVLLALVTEGPERWEMIDEAMAMVRARRYVRPVVELGEGAASLLRAAVQQPHVSRESRSQAEQLLERMTSEAEASRGSSSGLDPATGLEVLTEREAEVLGLLFQGMTNRALARHLFVSVDTVKTHLKHIYGKLGARNRGQAMQRARQMGYSPESD